jgi:hypothetical protein
MHNDIFDTVHRDLDQFKIERDATGRTAAAPATLHVANHQPGFGQAVPMGDGPALFQVSADRMPRSFPVPHVDGALDILPIGSVFYPDD